MDWTGIFDLEGHASPSLDSMRLTQRLKKMQEAMPEMPEKDLEGMRRAMTERLKALQEDVPFNCSTSAASNILIGTQLSEQY